MKKIKLLFAILVSVFFTVNTFAASVENIVPMSSESVYITFSSDVVVPDSWVVWDIKILRDIQVKNADKSSSNSKKITLNLLNELYPNSSYSIISVWWAEWSIEFELFDEFSWELINENLLNEEKIIEKVVVLDSKTIEVYYNYNLSDSVYDFKVLSELKIGEILMIGANVIEVKLDTLLEKSSFYMLMISSILDTQWKEVIFEEILYDFVTDSTLVAPTNTDNSEPVVVDVEDGVEQLVVAENQTEEDNSNLEQVAQDTKTVPETWPATWVALAFVVFLTTFLFMYKKKGA